MRLTPRTLATLAGIAAAYASATLAEADPSSSISRCRCGVRTDQRRVALQQPADLDKSPRPVIQIALLLDTSGSMDGLIEQAKTQLWSVVNELATAKRGAERPSLQVALYEYGKQSLPGETGFLRQITPLTDDLDKVSQELFALTTNGGEEYCGWVIKDAVERLDWSADRGDLKMIFIAGNEPFTQGPVEYTSSVPAAIERGIIVNTIFCGNRPEGESTGWADGARLADGEFMHIDQNHAVAHIPAPQDDELARLSLELNTTYLGFGAEGEAGQWNQARQDSNAATLNSAVVAQRAATKASALYNCSWDLVDACKQEGFKLEEVDVSDLPESMKSMSLEQRVAFVKETGEKRSAIQAQIQQLTQARDAFIAAERRALAERPGPDTLETAIVNCVREQAQRQRFEFAK